MTEIPFAELATKVQWWYREEKLSHQEIATKLIALDIAPTLGRTEWTWQAVDAVLVLSASRRQAIEAGGTMANRSPYRGRLGKKLRGKPGDMAQLLLILWHTLKRAQGVLDRAMDNDEEALKACHCISQVSAQYAKLLEIGELEARLAAVEQAMREAP